MSDEARRRTQRTPNGTKIPLLQRKDFDAVLDAATKRFKKPEASRV